MHSDPPATRASAGRYGIGRVEAFSDGVIAVAITLLVLDLKVPAGPAGLAQGLVEMWPNYLAYIISFVAIGIMWINHHAMLRRLAAVDHSVLVLNLLLLMCIVALPFTTSVFATYLDARSGGHLAALVYAGSFLVTSAVFFALQCLLVLRRPQLMRERLPVSTRRAILRRGAIAIPVYLVAALVGLITPYLTLAVCMVIGGFYLLPQRRRGAPPAAS